VRYIFPSCAVLVDEDSQYVETRFPDGTKVGSTPNRDDHSLRVAAELGYGDDTWTMSRDHELSHSWLAHLAGGGCSPTMWRLAHPESSAVPDDVQVAEEETAILDFQRSLDKRSPRPWDLAAVPSKAPLSW